MIGSFNETFDFCERIRASLQPRFKVPVRVTPKFEWPAVGKIGDIVDELTVELLLKSSDANSYRKVAVDVETIEFMGDEERAVERVADELRQLFVNLTALPLAAKSNGDFDWADFTIAINDPFCVVDVEARLIYSATNEAAAHSKFHTLNAIRRRPQRGADLPLHILQRDGHRWVELDVFETFASNSPIAAGN